MANLLSTSITGTAITSGSVVIGGNFTNNPYNNVSSTRLLFGGGNEPNNYFIGTNLENYGGNYTKLDLRWHTGIRMGAQPNYGGIRFFNNETLGSRIMSIGESDANVRIDNNLWIGGAGGWITDLFNAKYSTSGGAINGYVRINQNWAGGDYGAEAFTIRGTYPSITLRSTGNDSKWLIHHSNGNPLQFYFGGTVDNNEWYKKIEFASDGNIWSAYYGDWLSNIFNSKQNASTAITTSNIGSQSVSYASSAGNADTVDGRHADYFYPNNTDNGYFTGDINGSTAHQRLWGTDSVQDLIQFNAPTSMEYSTDGVNWTSMSIPLDVFSGKIYGAWGGIVANVGNNRGAWRFVRMTWVNFGYRFFSHFTLAHSTNGHSFNFVFQKSDLNGNNFTEAFRQNNISSWPGYTFVKHSNVSGWWDTRDIRLVFELNHVGDANNAINIGHIGIMGSYGSFTRLYDWDYNRKVYFANDIHTTKLVDANNNTYYFDGDSLTSLRTRGSWRADSADWDGEYSGKIQYHSGHWYFQAGDRWYFRNAGGSNVFEVTQAGNVYPNGEVVAPTLKARKAQSDNNYTTAALWTESYSTTTTGLAFHISGVVGKFLEMRTNGILYWDNNTVIHTGNIASQSVSYADESGFASSAGSVEWTSVQNKPSLMPLSGIPSGSDQYVNLRVIGNFNAGSGSGMHIGYGNQNGGNTLLYGGGGTSAQLYVYGDHVYSPSSFRAPIFYDSDDTAFYVDPNSSSRVRNLYVGDSGSNWSDPGGWGTQFHVSNGPHSIIRVYARSEGIETIMYSHVGGQSKVGSGTNHDFSIVRNFSDRMTFYSGYTYANGYLQAADSLRAPIFYDSNDTTYFLDPNADLSLRVYGEICNSNYQPGRLQPGALNIGRTDLNYAWDGTTWADDVRLGILANTNETWEFGIHDSGDSVMSVVHFDGGSTLTMGRNLGWGQCVVNAPAGYVSNGNAWGTANSAFFPNGITTAGGTNWIYGFTYIGNAPANGNGHEFNANGTQYSTTSITTPTFIVNSHSDNTRGYRIHNTSGTAVSAMFVNSSNQLVIAAGAVDQVNLNKKVYVNGVALGVNVAPSATAGRIDASNDIVAYSSSDERLKENITPIENALDKVKSLTGVEFDWKPEYKHAHGYEGHDTGIIAQQVEAVMPSAVRTNDTGFLAVRYEKLIGLLIEANKELAARVEELEKKLN